MAGTLPPPGTYLSFEPNHYSSDRLNDGNGDRRPLDFSANATSLAFHGLYILPMTVLGAQVAAHVVLPVIDLNVAVNGWKSRKFGLGDPAITPVILAWNLAPNVTLTAGVDVSLPLGQYNAKSPANIGRNTWAFQPTLGLSYIDREGWQAQVSPRFSFTTTNDATDYHSGADLTIDYAAGRNIGPWRLGVSGYYYLQYEDDTVAGHRVAADGHRGTAFAAGPAVSHNIGPVQATFTWQHEFMAENRAQAENFWIQGCLRF
ncbi:MAG: transporter [Azospirillaceae bacterium]|nr:transporter [Azospirillaceae bacterium]